MSELPHVEVSIVEGGQSTVIIDGKLFPWWIAEDGVSVDFGRGQPVVTVTLLAESVKVSHSFATHSE